MNAPTFPPDLLQERCTLIIADTLLGNIDAQEVIPFAYAETATTYEVRAFLPGVRVQDIQVALWGRRLQVRINTYADSASSADSGTCYGEVTVPLGSKPGLVQAAFHDGLLVIRMNKRQTGRLN